MTSSDIGDGAPRPALLRRIEPLAFPDIEPGGADMARPVYRDVSPTDLLVDESYQRNLSERSRTIIRRILTRWDWRAFKPPNVAEIGDELHVIDGQHTAVAAASHPAIDTIPIQIVDGPETADRATAFVRINSDRVGVTGTQLHHALVAAGDEDALTIEQVCSRAGARVLKAPPGGGLWKEGDTVAVKTIAAIIRRRYAIGARKVLSLLVEARMAPISRDALMAVESLLFEPEYASSFRPEDLATLIRERHAEMAREAKLFSIEHRVPVWRGLSAHLYRNVKKVRHGRQQQT